MHICKFQLELNLLTTTFFLCMCTFLKLFGSIPIAFWLPIADTVDEHDDHDANADDEDQRLPAVSDCGCIRESISTENNEQHIMQKGYWMDASH